MSIAFDWDSYVIAMLAINVALSGTLLGLRLVKRLRQKPVEAPACQSSVEFTNRTVRDRLSASSPKNSTKSSAKSIPEEIV